VPRHLLFAGYDLLVLFGALAMVAARPPLYGAEACSPALLSAPVVLLLCVGLVLGLGRARFGFGSSPDNAVLALAATVSGIGALVLWRPACGAPLAVSWATPVVLLALPRAMAALVRSRLPSQRAATAATQSASVHPPAVRGVGRRTAWIVTLSRPVDEPRVRRQADALRHGGWDVVAIGYKGVAPKPDFWTLVEIPSRPHSARERSALAEVLDPERLWQPWALAAARISQREAERYYWLEQLHRQNLEDILRAADSHGLRCDLVANHDFYTLPIAARLAQRFNVPFTTDVHEYARGQYMHRAYFRWLYTHYVHSLQRRHFPRAALLTVVCKGIAELLDREYELKRPSLVIRNVSSYEAMPFRPVGEKIRVLYHGLLCEARGLEEAIASLPLWREEFELVLRGPGEKPYIDSLLRLARSRGVEARLRFEPAVPLTELIGTANRCDIGFFASADYSPQKRFTAPNKLFEYVTAGLALCVSDLPEMRRVVAEHDVGRLFPSLAPAAIAHAINGFTRDTIEAYKRRSLEAARVLCWETERDALIRAYDELTGVRVC
jgi:glycosyltransferase involved in cell wall biosynthesis